MEGGCLWGEGVETDDTTAKLPSDNRSINFFIEADLELCYVPFRKLFSLRVNNPASAYIIWKNPKDFRRENFCQYSPLGLVEPEVGD